MDGILAAESIVNTAMAAPGINVVRHLLAEALAVVSLMPLVVVLILIGTGVALALV